MIQFYKDLIATMFIGNMGIKRVFLGAEELYSRPGGYFYLELEG